MSLTLPLAFIQAQSTSTDSLRKVWYQQGATYTEAQRLEAGFLLVAHYSKQNYDSLRYISSEMEAYGRRSKNRKWMVYGLSGKAEVFRRVGESNPTISCYYRALKYVDSEEEDLVVGIYNSLGEQYRDLNRQDSAVYYFTKALNLADKYQHYTYADKLFGNFGQYHYERGNYLKALKLWDRGLKHSQSTQKIFRLLDIGSLLQEIGLTEDARTHLQHALQLANNFAEDPSLQVNVYSVLIKTAPDWSTFERLLKKGTSLSDSYDLNFPKQRLFESAAKVYLDAQQLTQAEFYLNRLSDMPWVINTNRGIGVWVLLARLEHKKNNYQKSIQACNAVLAKIETAKFVKENIELYNLLYKNYLMLNNRDSAFVYLQKSVDLEAQLNDKMLIRTAIGTYLKEQGKQEQTALRRDKKIAELKLHSALISSRMDNWVFGLVSTLLFTIVMAMIFIFRQEQQVSTRLMSINSLLEQEQQKLKATNAKLRRFSGVVSHDILSNLDLILSTGNVLVGSRPNPSSKSLNQYFSLTQQTSRQLKDYCLGLLAEAHTAPGIELVESGDPNTILHKLLERFGPALQEKRVAVEQGELLPIPLPSSIKEQVLQNLLSNVLHHVSEVAHPRLRVGSAIDQGGSICWYVEDNGPGDALEINRKIEVGSGPSDRASKGQGMGLRLLQLTLAEYGWSLKAEAVEGQGLRMSVVNACTPSGV